MPTFEGEAMPHDTDSADLRDRAESFRATLGARQEADAILAEVADVRRRAAEDAERLVGQAETLAADLTRQAQAAAEQTTAEARERADGILARAREAADEVADQARRDAEEARAQFQAELEAENRARLHGVRHRAEELLTGIDVIVRGLGSALQQAEGSVFEMERSLTHLRDDAIARLPETPSGPSPRELAEAAEAAERSARTEAALSGLSVDAPRVATAAPDPALLDARPATSDPVSSDPVSSDPVPAERVAPAPGAAPAPDRAWSADADPDQRPLGWLFRSTRS